MNFTNQNEQEITINDPSLNMVPLERSTNAIVNAAFCEEDIFDFAFIETHIPSTDNYFPVYENQKFGVLKMKTKETKNMCNQPLYIHFTLDYSGSMEEYTKTRTSKLQIVLHTVKNIVRFLAEKNWKNDNGFIKFGIDAFNHEYRELFPVTRIPKDDEELGDFEMMLAKKDHAFGNTDIELALKESNRKINDYKSENPGHKILHFFLTDGEPTSGETKEDILAKFTDDSYPTIYVGYGAEHNSKILQALSKSSGFGSSYEYIHDYEKVTDAYGEVLHKYLYPVLKSFSVRCHGCRMYDSKNGAWVTEYTEGMVAGNQELVYSVILDGGDIEAPVPIYIELFENGEIIEVADILPPLVFELEDGNQSEKYVPNDLSTYIFRQQVMELLAFVSEIDAEDTGLIDSAKNKLNELFRKIREYMNKCTDLEEKDKKVLNVLCDDLYISYTTIGTNLGHTFTISRQTTHARQTSYRIHLDLDELTQTQGPSYGTNIHRQNTRQRHFDFDLGYGLDTNATVDSDTTQVLSYNADDIRSYDYQGTQDLLYSPNVRQTIREISRY